MGQQDSSINIQTAYTSNTYTEFMRTVVTKWFESILL